MWYNPAHLFATCKYTPNNMMDSIIQYMIRNTKLKTPLYYQKRCHCYCLADGVRDLSYHFLFIWFCFFQRCVSSPPSSLRLWIWPVSSDVFSLILLHSSVRLAHLSGNQMMFLPDIQIVISCSSYGRKGLFLLALYYIPHSSNEIWHVLFLYDWGRFWTIFTDSRLLLVQQVSILPRLHGSITWVLRVGSSLSVK